MELQIVGFPYLVDGSESVQCEDVKFFVHEFLKNSGITIPIVYHNELYTTQIAMEPYSGKRRRDWNEGLRKKDQNAAAVILQEFLDDFLCLFFLFLNVLQIKLLFFVRQPNEAQLLFF